MFLRRLSLVAAAAVLFGGESSQPSFQIECACPISVQGGPALSYRSAAKVRVLRKASVTWIIADGEPENLSVTLPAARNTVVVRSVRGDVDVRNLRAPVQVLAWSGNASLDQIEGDAMAQAGGQVKAGGIRGKLHVFSTSSGIAVGRVDGEVWCETAGGEIIVERAGGPLRAITGGGNVYIAEALSNVEAKSDGGLIDVRKAGGEVTAVTRGGSIHVGAAKSASCESAAGAIRVRGVSGFLRARTGMGSILAELLGGSRLEESILATAAGDITVLIPSNLAMSVEAVNESRGKMARIISEFPEIRVAAARGWTPGTLAARGSMNGGGPVLHISGAGGTVYLRRQPR